MEVTALRESFHSHLDSQCEVTKDKFYLPPIFKNVRSKKLKNTNKKANPRPSAPRDTNHCWSYCQFAGLLLARA